MGEMQQYQLKLAVSHHKSLKTQQLIQFLQNQSNQFLTNDFPQSLTSDNFVTIFEQLQQTETNDFSQYVGLLLLYNSSSVDSYQFIKKNIPKQQFLTDLFMIIVEMNNSDKKVNVIGNEGEKFCQKFGYQFVKLSLYNSEDLVNCMHKNLYHLIENYYYSNNDEKLQKKNQQLNYIFHYGTQGYSRSQQKIQSTHNETITPSAKNVIPSQKQKKHQKIIATKQERGKIKKLIEKATELRESRKNQNIKEQLQIDQSIQNVEKVLRTINKEIDNKIKSDWFTSLNHTLYSPLEKNSMCYAKSTNLTQEFVEDSQESDDENAIIRISKMKSSDGKSKKRIRSPFQPEKAAMVNKFITKHRKLQPILKLLLVLSDSIIAEVDVFEESEYQQLAVLAMRKLGITESQHNFQVIRKIIEKKIQNFVKELSYAVKTTEKIRIDQRSFLKLNSQNNNLNKSNVCQLPVRSQTANTHHYNEDDIYCQQND